MIARIGVAAAGLVLSLPAAASVDETVDAIMRPLADLVSGFIFFAVEFGDAQLPLIVLWLIAAGVFFTVYLGFINVRGFMHAVALVRGKFADPKDPGEISQFQALATAVSGTVGIGNIAGVAVAISLGGPGATFWLIVAGLLGMSTKFVECTLGVMYRGESGGETAGGPMYYLRAGLERRGWPLTGRGLGAFYAAAMVVGCLGIGNMFQSNQAAAIFITVTGGDASLFADSAWLLGLVMAVAVGLVIVGGIHSIAATTSRLVPLMAVLYVVSCFVILIARADALPAAIGSIVSGAFSPQGVAGGVLGVMILGFRRAVFSNEAGLGSASIAHSTARTSRPVSEGYVALLEPFLDTVVICTMTALVIVTTVYTPELAGAGISGIELTSRAFASVWSGAPVPLSIAAILFAFSTMIAWSYYGLRAFTYLVGGSAIAALLFKLVFLAFVVLGASVQLGALIDLSDALVFVVAIPNIIGLYIMAPEVKRALREYEEEVL